MPTKNTEIKLIVGLGNPGAQYEQTRHNAGFWLVDELARKHGGFFRSETKFKSEAVKVSIQGNDVWLLKPLTFMNKSGEAIRQIANFYKIKPEEILVAHDELDLDPGVIKLKTGGGHGGHNGLRDTISQLGTKDFLRMRIGVGHPGDKRLVTDFVLNKPRQEERVAIERTVDDGVDAITLLCKELSLEKAMHWLHSRTY